jgi:hypothetical protein
VSGGRAVIVCDVWDRHWCSAASERLGPLAEQIQAFLSIVRERGVQVIHAPTAVIDAYRWTPARRRISLDGPHRIEYPMELGDGEEYPPLSHACPDRPAGVWRRQHPAILIDQGRDAASARQDEILRYLRFLNVECVWMTGVHLTLCVLYGPFGVRVLRRAGFGVVVVSDLVDVMSDHTPEAHDEMLTLSLTYMERVWCPVVGSSDLVQRVALA